MWYRNALRRGAIYNNPSVSACLQFLACDRINDIASRRPTRRLSASNECTIGEVIDRWSRRFEAEGVPEPVESIEHIIAHVTGTRKVSETLRSLITYSLFFSSSKIFRRTKLTDGYIACASHACSRRMRAARLPLALIGVNRLTENSHPDVRQRFYSLETKASAKIPENYVSPNKRRTFNVTTILSLARERKIIRRDRRHGRK